MASGLEDGICVLEIDRPQSTGYLENIWSGFNLKSNTYINAITLGLDQFGLGLHQQTLLSLQFCSFLLKRLLW